MRFFFLFLALSALAFAEDPFVPNLKRTSHVYTGDGKSLYYTAITGEFPVINGERKKLAELFFVAYMVEETPDRPITFIFPGGPGGAVDAEILCTVGPRRLKTPEEGKSLLPPYEIIDNPESLLPWTDLVFVEPVTTGYSKFAEGVEEKEKDLFFNTEGDIASLGEFVQTFISYFQKWNCPKYLSGISYGTLRCCGLAEYLAAQSLGLHGIILLGSAIDFSTLEGDRKDILPDSLLIPTFAATAWYHGRLWPEGTIQQVTDYARRFLYDEYLPFMIQPTRLGMREKNAFYEKLSELIGLKSETVQRYLGRFDETLFTTEFMGLERKVIGGLDTRYVGDLSSLRRIYMEDDPSYKDMLGISCAFNAYLQKELETFRPFEKYNLFTNRHLWNFSTYDSKCWPDVFQRLRRTLVWNPSMKIFSGSGYYDCRTPFAATEYCFQHLELPASYLRSFQFEYYEGGHGFVFDLSCLKKLQKDLIAFYERKLQ